MMFPQYTKHERRADGLVHILGLAFAAVAVPLLLHSVAQTREALMIASVAVYCAGLVAMLSFSASYNLVSHPGWKAVLRRYDHAAIFVMIAGTYTPFTLISMGDALGHALLSLVWLVALLGAAVKLLMPGRFERASIALYLALGWIMIFAIEPLILAVDRSSLMLLAVGGILYSAGVVFHLWERLTYSNAIWHAFVLAAAACHYVAVLKVVSGT